MRQTIQFDVGARRNGYIVLGLSIISILISIAVFAIGPFLMDEIDVEKEAIFTGRTGDVPVVENGMYSVFVVSDYTCEEVEVSIYEEDEEMIWEYFFRDCDDFWDEDGWIYVGYFSTDFDGSLNVEANRQILIIDDISYFGGGFWSWAMVFALPVCCIGIIGLIIAVTILITAKEKIQDKSANPGIVFIEPSSPPEEKVQDDVEESSEWWEMGSKP
tara:strand:- start:31 stop:678 length:648 start_codon:yes stop_codon:yes gene_type:complete